MTFRISKEQAKRAAAALAAMTPAERAEMEQDIIALMPNATLLDGHTGNVIPRSTLPRKGKGAAH